MDGGMLTPVALAFLAAALGVAGAWELIAALERARPVAIVVAALEPLSRAGHGGRAATVDERRRLALVAAASLAAAGWLLGGAWLAALAAVSAPAIAFALLRARRRAYGRALAAGAAGAARTLADALAAGHSIRGAITVAADGMTGPAGVELRRTASGLALGAPTEPALEALRQRARSRPWDTIVAGILLQRDAGGDLPALLRELAAALEAADRLERDARTATAQARFTAWLVVGLPVAAAVLAELAAPGFLAALVAAPLPAALTACALALQAAGLAVIHRIVRMRHS
jgi:tight adherence protein B